jgi:PAS domain S-box-containing protein
MTKSTHQPPDTGSDYYELLLNSIDDYPVFTTDKDGLVNTWNCGAEQLVGYSKREIIGKNSAVFFTDADLRKSEDKKELHNAKEKGSAADERYHVRKDGSVFWASGKVFPLMGKDGKHIGFTKVMRNLDERKLADEQLNHVRSYADAIVSNSRHPILVLKDDLTIYTANKAFYKLFGCEALLAKALL